MNRKLYMYVKCACRNVFGNDVFIGVCKYTFFLLEVGEKSGFSDGENQAGFSRLFCTVVQILTQCRSFVVPAVYIIQMFVKAVTVGIVEN